MDFRRYQSPHTGEAFSRILTVVPKKWKLQDRIRARTTDNSSDILSDVATVYDHLQISNYGLALAEFHSRCIAHIKNLGVKECM